MGRIRKAEISLVQNDLAKWCHDTPKAGFDWTGFWVIPG